MIMPLYPFIFIFNTYFWPSNLPITLPTKLPVQRPSSGTLPLGSYLSQIARRNKKFTLDKSSGFRRLLDLTMASNHIVLYTRFLSILILYILLPWSCCAWAKMYLNTVCTFRISPGLTPMATMVPALFPFFLTIVVLVWL